MKIDLTTNQYEILIKALETSAYIYGPMSDMVDKKYKKVNEGIEQVIHELLNHSKEFSYDKNVENFNGKNHLNEEVSSKILDELAEYDEWQLWDNLAYKLAWRDFRKIHSRKEIEEIFKKNEGYLGVEIYEYEKKYYDEFETYEYDRLYIVK